ncbi:MAG: hypothetical protein IPG73_13500 [Ignavibacteria bacterium]|nr:hypothetical protein [Ignavibacteria bacterium]
MFLHTMLALCLVASAANNGTAQDGALTLEVDEPVISKLVSSESDPSVILACRSNAQPPLISLDGGCTWNAWMADNDSIGANVLQTAVHLPQSSSSFMIEQDRTIRITDDLGASWRNHITFTTGAFHSYRFHPMDSTIIYGFSSDNSPVGRFNTKQRTWRSSSVDTSAGPFGSVVDAFFTKTNPGASFLVSSNGDVYQSRDTGSTFLRTGSVNEGGRQVSIILACDDDDPDRLYARHVRGISTSSDAGKTWKVQDLGSDSWISGIEQDKADPSLLWAYGDAIYRSTDGGSTWSQVNDSAGDHTIGLLVGKRLVTWSTLNGLIRFSKDGSTWEKLDSRTGN